MGRLVHEENGIVRISTRILLSQDAKTASGGYSVLMKLSIVFIKPAALCVKEYK